ncbi:stage III sporulation protein AF [Hathewaya proteolytica DSM 3090]|uniref:Stage III sporulation protein AF n=1 Tax=Hathewaya proteolytica DSM 3090 TaxID=1121331 RepID=A0A1M6L563_9CLOT|nr:stage III sporulation protein AF [Hathewaya proteolytica]SHJ66341.1 stage III sporulation protein AF [Hathewaya proteolytica DSM 3090]
MMDMLKQWIINLCGVVILITAVEMILPDNSIKKYSKYVLGLIILLVLISPIIKLYNGEFDAEVYLSKSESYFQDQEYKKNIEIYKKNNDIKTVEVFKENLSKQCIKLLKNTYKKDEFHIFIQVYEKENVISISSINIGVREGGVKNIKKVIIGKSEEEVHASLDDSNKANKIKEIICNYTGVDAESISVYKEE